jgi:hypothetical protein
MAKGICYKSECDSIIELDGGTDGRTTCVHCNATSLNSTSAARYRAYERQLAANGPTPDPKVDAASPQPVPSTDPAQAFKSDAGKVQFDLLEDGAPNALLEIAKVMSWAVEVKGYHPHSWQEIPDAIRRYKAALGRHRNAIARGEVLDPESGLLHWAHAACCVIFITELEIRSKP